MSSVLDDPRLEELGHDDRIVAFDALLRGALFPHLHCGCGLGPSVATAVMLSVLGAVAFQAGLTPEGLEEEGFWDQIKLNFKAGYTVAAQDAMEGVTVQ